VTVTAREVGDDAMALSARQRLAPLLDGITDPYLHAASQLAMAWTSPIVDDLDGALREASASLEEFRGQDEPLGTTSAGLTLGSVETTVGRYDDALRHLTEARNLAVRLDNAWLAATSQVLLGTLALVQGRLEDAQALLEEALDLSLAARSTQLVTLCLAGFARLALVEGNAERAALLAGALVGLGCAGVDGEPVFDDARHRSALGDVEESSALSIVQVTVKADPSDDLIAVADALKQELDVHSGERPALAVGVHAQGDGRAGTKRRQQQLCGSRRGIGAMRRRLVGGQLMTASSQLDVVAVGADGGTGPAELRPGRLG
jgi:tetratricopeptide (TPR) repeat protein